MVFEIENNKSPKISVIIPCWNAEKFIYEAICSVLDQSYQNIEVIVVNDGSTDGTQEVVDKFKDRIRMVVLENGGACRARNIGLDTATGTFIKFLDADDVLSPNALELEMGLVSSKIGGDFKDQLPISGAVLTDANLLNPKPFWQVPKKYLLDGASIDLDWIMFNTPPIGAPLYRRARLISIGGFNEALTNRQDNDLFVRYIIDSEIPVFTQETTYSYRQYVLDKRTSKIALTRNSPSQTLLLQSHIAELRSIANEAMKASVARATARRAWSWGRTLARVEAYKEAAAHFQIAYELEGAGYSYGSFVYRTLTKLIGPIRSEIVLESAKRILLSKREPG